MGTVESGLGGFFLLQSRVRTVSKNLFDEFSVPNAMFSISPIRLSNDA